MEIQGFKYHYVINPKKGDTVSYGNGAYRVHDDGRGWLHIIVQENNIRRKISINHVKQSSFQPGTEADYVFNEWWKMYDFKTYQSFMMAELKWVE